ncbi:hypothetical protein Pan161_01210 [Gimesia algae]|uniref:Uncharacterized protein n=1 Tax=Gimesia algae TaxID=2527971 RepID=A0A517V680_9PLAN|nr:hypothetical protein Pan161_01210 [Gimesia algae]
MNQSNPLFNKTMFFCAGTIALLFTWFIGCLVITDSIGRGISTITGCFLFAPAGGQLLSAKQYLFSFATLLLCLGVSLATGILIGIHLMSLSLTNSLVVGGIGGLLGLLKYGLLWAIQHRLFFRSR